MTDTLLFLHIPYPIGALLAAAVCWITWRVCIGEEKDVQRRRRAVLLTATVSTVVSGLAACTVWWAAVLSLDDIERPMSDTMTFWVDLLLGIASVCALAFVVVVAMLLIYSAWNRRDWVIKRRSAAES